MKIRSKFSTVNHSFGRLAGYAVTSYPTAGSLEREIQFYLRVIDVRQFLDVGAHEGGFGRKLRRLGFKGKIQSFEPALAAYIKLQDVSSDDPSWTVENVGLGSRDGALELNSFDSSQFNSFRNLSDHAARYVPNLAAKGSETVTVRRLDGIANERGIKLENCLLKIDTQGYDMEVIAGAGERIREIPAVLMEVAVEPLYEGVPRLDEVIASLRGLGFELTGAFPIHRYDGGLRVIEFDCMFLNVQVL